MLAAVSDGQSNCFIVAPGNTAGFTFKVSRAYTYSGSAFTNTLRVDGTTYTGSFGTAVVWDDNSVVSSVAVSGSGKDAQR
jgi:UDP-3-O-acyl-N-acetylglucosamine deacetylase